MSDFGKEGYIEKICHSESNNENKKKKTKQMLFQLQSRKLAVRDWKKYCDTVCFMQWQQFNAVKILQC